MGDYASSVQSFKLPGNDSGSVKSAANTFSEEVYKIEKVRILPGGGRIYNLKNINPNEKKHIEEVFLVFSF